MNLKEFVKEVLIDLDSAIDESREVTKRDLRFSDGSSKRTVEFDVAVSVENADSKSGKAGIKVLQFAEAGGDINETNKNVTVSRIQFGVHIDSSTKAEEARNKPNYAQMEKIGE